MKIILVTDDDEVLNTWTIGDKPEFDIEDLDAIPEHDFYMDGNYTNYSNIGQEIWDEIWNYKLRSSV